MGCFHNISSFFRKCPLAVHAAVMLVFLIVTVLCTSLVTKNFYNRNEVKDWILVGGITSSRASFRIRMSTGSKLRVVVSESDDLASSIVFEKELSSTGDVQVLSVEAVDLRSDTTHHYGTFLDDGRLGKRGSFRTAGPEGTQINFMVAAAGCAWTGSKHDVFSRIAAKNPLLFLHLGDFHYEDINEDNLDMRLKAIDTVLGSASQADLFRSMGLVYMWDDHDWLGNDSTGAGVGREAALESYSLAFPHYSPLPAALNSSNSEVSPYHAFTVGSVRFIVTDLRSEATEESIYSVEQKHWLFAELSNSSLYDFVVWVSTKPWIGKGEKDDTWLGYPDDRSELSDWITQKIGGPGGKENLLVVSADAHMVAFDDGSNTYYGTDTSSDIVSFPILQTGPMDRLGSAKGGPFSEGCHTTRWERNHQYSTIEYQVPSEADGEPCLEIKSYRVEGSRVSSQKEIFSKRLCGRIFNSTSNAGSGSCEASTFSTISTVYFSISGGFCGLIILCSCFLFQRSEAIKFSACIFVLYAVTLALGFYVPVWTGVPQFETSTIFLISMLQMIAVGTSLCILHRAQENRKALSNERANEAKSLLPE